LKELGCDSRLHRNKILNAAKALNPEEIKSHKAPETSLRLLSFDVPLRVADFAQEVEHANRLRLDAEVEAEEVRDPNPNPKSTPTSGLIREASQKQGVAVWISSQSCCILLRLRVS